MSIVHALTLPAAADPLGGLLKVGAIVTFAGVVIGLLVLFAAVKMTSQSSSKNTRLRDHGRSSGLLLIGLAWGAVGALILGGVAILTVFGDAIRTFIGF